MTHFFDDPPALEPALQRVYGRIPPGRRLTPLKGEASSRRYYRLTITDPATPAPDSLIVMQLPPDAPRSDEGPRHSAPAPAEPSGRSSERELPFMNVQRMLRERDLPVPEVYAVDLARRVLLLEDLGDESFETRLLATSRDRWPALYGEAVDLVADLHERCAEPDSKCIAYERAFDAPLLRWELDHFREWGLEALNGKVPAADGEALDDCFEQLARQLTSAPGGFVHRDYQSRNLMHAPARHGALVIIDFQDALLGPRPYDLVSLLCDSYIDVDPELQRAMIDRYTRRRGLDAENATQFEYWFWKTAVHRKLKDAGRFVYIDRVRKNSSFLRWYPPSLRYVGRALAHLRPMDADSDRLHSLLSRLVPGFPGNVTVPQSG